jgi:hypothetical protein
MTADLIVTGCMALAQGEEFEEAGVNAQILHWDEVPSAVLTGSARRLPPTPSRSSTTKSGFSPSLAAA